MADYRVGTGFDAHALVEGVPLVLGGVHVPFDRGLAGFSDGDVLAHALTDAVLGAAGLEDIGAMFPSGDERWNLRTTAVFFTPKNFVFSTTTSCTVRSASGIGSVS